MFKINLEMCWNIKVNFADRLQYRRGPPGGSGPRLKTPDITICESEKWNFQMISAQSPLLYSQVDVVYYL